MRCNLRYLFGVSTKQKQKNGKFITTDLSVCMDSRFDKIVKI